MANAFFNVPKAVNEPVKTYAPGTQERKNVLDAYKKMYNETIDVPMYIGGEEIRTGDTATMSPPHDHKHILGTYHKAKKQHVELAISNALEARKTWAETPWEDRAAIFLKAAELLAGPYRAKMNAATMLAQSKNVFQAEIDAACELIDFLTFNVQFMTEIYQNQPISDKGIWNRMEYRPLEGFIYAVTPFNFTAIAGNLSAAPAILGNVVVWKPSDSQVYSAKVIVELFKEAGLPDGVINVVYGDPVMISNIVLGHKDFSGLHFTGSTHVFKHLWPATDAARYNTLKDVDEVDELEEKIDLARKHDWVRRLKKFGNTHMKGDLDKVVRCLKEVSILHKYNKLKHEIEDIDWSTVDFSEESVKQAAELEVACAGGACEI